MVGIQTPPCGAVHQHGLLSLYTMLKGPSIVDLDFYLPWYGLWMIFKGSFMALGFSWIWLLIGVQMDPRFMYPSLM